MRISLDALQVLDAIEARGSFAAAAAALNRVPSALTHAVRKLEDDLAVTLFVRAGRRAVLTPAGRLLLEEGRHLLGAAGELECRVQRIATGWEHELRIAVESVLDPDALWPLIADFYKELSGTRLRLSSEVLGGCWDALVSGRADLCIGAPGEPPPEPGYTVRPLGEVDWVFAVAPHHPLAQSAQPVPTATVMEHRMVIVADSSRNLPPRSSGITPGPDALVVSTIRSKVEAQIAGLGVGFLPRHVAAEALAAGTLVALEVEDPKARSRLHFAWRQRDAGKALKWWVSRLEEASVRERLLSA